MIPDSCIEVHTSPLDRPSVPAWFAEVVIVAGHLASNGLLEAFAQQVRLVRGRFGSYEPIDFLALLIGYAISGERTLSDFFERIAPFGVAFMALFGRNCLAHRSRLSRFLADVDRPCLEAFRTLFQQHTFAQGGTSETLGGSFDRKARRYIVFDVDATRQAARQRALPCAAELPPPRRRLDAVCAPGYGGRKHRINTACFLYLLLFFVTLTVAEKQSMAPSFLAVPVQRRLRDAFTCLRSMFTSQGGKQFSYTVHAVAPVEGVARDALLRQWPPRRDRLDAWRGT